MKKCFIVLENGQVFEGMRFGAEVDTLGELVFNTGMVGYVQTLTDPSYYGQIVMQTFPLIGNYGMIPPEQESGRCALKGYVVREWCDTPSNFRSEGTIDEFLKQQGVPGVYGVDTRQITRIIREYGVMNARIVDEVNADTLRGIREYRVTGALSGVSTRQRAAIPACGEKKHTIALVDYGAKHNIVRELTRRGCEVVLLPYDTTAEEICALKPDGLVLSNGPGDPADNPREIEQIRALVGRMPIMGICLGHQLLSLAMGARTTKLKYGHRGANQPVKRVSDGHMYITSQNHGYAVVSDSLPKSARLSYINTNDMTCEGVEYPEVNAFSVQFHPEACAGPKDTDFLFDQFLSNVEVQ